MWEIIDNKGVIYSGTENEMTDLFHDIMHGGPAAPLKQWTGDLKLIQIHAIHK